jgi:uncharacterized protein (DUF2164 family)
MAIEIKREDKTPLIHSIQRYFAEEFEIEMGEMKAGFILSYFLEEIGPFVYNKAISDAENFLAEKVADLSASCYEQGLNYWKKKGK